MHKYVNKLAQFLAVLGGAILVLMIVITCLSVIGRIFNSVGHSGFITMYLPFLGSFFQWFRPITGDYELIEAGAALAIFMFLPWCQLNRGHATVELFTAMLPSKANRFLSAFWEIIFALVIILITWRLYEGMLGKIRNGETTFLLQMPVWWSYAIASFAAFLASVVAVYSTWLRVKESWMHSIPPGQKGGVGLD